MNTTPQTQTTPAQGISVTPHGWSTHTAQPTREVVAG